MEAQLKKIRKLISKGDPDQALREFIELVNNNKELITKEDIKNQLELLSGQLSKWKKEYNLGLEPKEANLRRIELAILELASAKVLTCEKVEIEEKSTHHKLKKVLPIFLFLILIIIMSYLQFCKKNKINNNISVTDNISQNTSSEKTNSMKMIADKSEEVVLNKVITTLIGNSYPYTLPSILKQDGYNVLPHYITKSSNPSDDFDNNLQNSDVLLIGETHNEFTLKKETIRNFLYNGGTVIHFCGWKEDRLLRALDLDLTFRQYPQTPIDNNYSKISVNQKLNNPELTSEIGLFNWNSAPVFSYITDVKFSNKWNVLLEVKDTKKPFLIYREFEKGIYFLILSNIQLPASPYFMIWDDYKDFLKTLIDYQSKISPDNITVTTYKGNEVAENYGPTLNYFLEYKDGKKTVKNLIEIKEKSVNYNLKAEILNWLISLSKSKDDIHKTLYFSDELIKTLESSPKDKLCYGFQEAEITWIKKNYYLDYARVNPKQAIDILTQAENEYIKHIKNLPVEQREELVFHSGGLYYIQAQKELLSIDFENLSNQEILSSLSSIKELFQESKEHYSHRRCNYYIAIVDFLTLLIAEDNLEKKTSELKHSISEILKYTKGWIDNEIKLIEAIQYALNNDQSKVIEKLGELDNVHSQYRKIIMYYLNSNKTFK